MKSSRKLLDYLVCSNVKEKVCSAFKKVDRALFVPVEFLQQAYLDIPLPIDKNSTISQPTLVAEMIDLLDLKGDEKVLEIGTGSGYSSAILSFCCKNVETIEINSKLAKEAKNRLKKLGIENVNIHIGNGVKGVAKKAPFDAIIITAAMKEVSKVLSDQLKDGGILVYPREYGKDYQMLMLGSKKEDRILEKRIIPVNFVHLIS